MRAARRAVGLGLAALAVACGGEVPEVAPGVGVEVGQSEAPLYLARPGVGVPEEYLVVLRAEAKGEPAEVARQVSSAPFYVYQSAVRGFAARLNAAQLEAVRKDPRVAYVEQNQVVSVEAPQGGFQAQAIQAGAPWHLDRIDQRYLPLSTNYVYYNLASNIYAYVIDLGIQSSHPEFEGRASNPYDALGGNGEDCNGLGTFVAGLIGSKTYGVAKKVNLRGIRVLNCTGSGTTAAIVAGFDWVRVNAQRPAVAHTSVGGPLSTALNTAAQNLVNSGITLTTGAGSSNANSCNYSPASATGVLAAASVNNLDQRASFSNFGSCVDVYAPGVNLTSTWLNGGTNLISSNASSGAIISGVAALYKSAYGDQPSATVNSWITTIATPNVVINNPAGTPNLLLYTGGL